MSLGRSRGARGRAMNSEARRAIAATVVAGVLATAGLVGLAQAPALATTSDLSSWSLTTVPSGSALTLNLTKVSLRGPDFDVKVQQADGTFTDVTSLIPAEQDYLGTVQGHPDAAVAATVLSDGTVEGEVVFDRGITWWFTGNAVTGTRGTTSVTYKWPDTQPMTTDVIGSTQYQDEVGYDLDSSLYTAFGNNPVKALDMVQYSLNMQRLPWIQDAGVTPVVGTVILRGSSAQDPYASLTASGGAYLGAVGKQWKASTWTATPGGYPDTQVQVVSNRFGGGVAWINDISKGGNFGAVGGGTTGWAVVARHEGAHNFGIHDEQGGDPEGPTIQSGNQFARWDSTELYALGNQRAHAAAQGWIKQLPTYTATPLPPYAATSYIQTQAHGARITFNPLAADHSANGSPLRLVSVQGTSTLGAKVARSGNDINYNPLMAPTSSIDTFTYVVADANGNTATGVVMVKNLEPFHQLEAETGTTISGGTAVIDGSDHSGTGQVNLSSGAGHSITWTVNQPATRDVTLTFMTKNWNAGSATVSIDGAPATTLSVPAATWGAEGETPIWTPVTMTVHLTAGTHTIRYSTVDVAQYIDYLRLDWADNAPTWTQSVNTTVKAGQAFSIPLSGASADSDLPNDSISYKFPSPYSWMKLSGSSIIGTAPSAGTYTSLLRVVDASGLLTTVTFTLTVTS